MMVGDNDDNVSVASVESNKFVAVTHPMSPANSPNCEKNRISSVKGRPQFTKRNKRKAGWIQDRDWFRGEVEREVKLKERWRWTLWRFTCYKLRSLSRINKLKAKHEIGNIVVRFQHQQDDKSNLSPNHQTQNHRTREFIRSPPPRPRTLAEVSNPVYNLQHNQWILFCQISVRSEI